MPKWPISFSCNNHRIHQCFPYQCTIHIQYDENPVNTTTLGHWNCGCKAKEMTGLSIHSGHKKVVVIMRWSLLIRQGPLFYHWVTTNISILIQQISLLIVILGINACCKWWVINRTLTCCWLINQQPFNLFPDNQRLQDKISPVTSI